MFPWRFQGSARQAAAPVGLPGPVISETIFLGESDQRPSRLRPSLKQDGDYGLNLQVFQGAPQAVQAYSNRASGGDVPSGHHPSDAHDQLVVSLAWQRRLEIRSVSTMLGKQFPGLEFQLPAAQSGLLIREFPGEPGELLADH